MSLFGIQISEGGNWSSVWDSKERDLLTLFLTPSPTFTRLTKMTMIAEGAEAKRVEEAQEKRKRKIEDDKRWEGEFGFPSLFWFLFAGDLKRIRSSSNNSRADLFPLPDHQ